MGRAGLKRKIKEIEEEDRQLSEQLKEANVREKSVNDEMKYKTLLGYQPHYSEEKLRL